MDERTLDRIFAGILSDLPPVTSKIVRIFTSSTFTDMSMERNCLMENVYPKIKEYCKEKHGLEFQVVDMRWGVRDEATDDHMTTDLCMNEIKNCQRLSVGPNFVTFLGQKYGYRPIPTYIEGTEFHKLCAALTEMNITEVELLYKWYREDTNAIPSTFILQPISSILYHFNNKKEPELMAKDQSIWWDTLNKLQKVLRLAACHLHEQGMMTDEEKHNYIMAVTEREVINGVLKLKETRNTCLAYVRTIQKINMSNTQQVNKFLDLIDGEADTEAAQLLADLRDRRLVNKIHPDNIIKFKLDWSDKGGLNEDDHYDYLCEFINHFYKHIIKLVRRAMRKEDSSAFGRIVTEILQHSHACSHVSRIFLGRTEELQSIKEYITGSLNRPMILHGAGGSGKTCLLAKAATLIRHWIGKDKCIMVLRFNGTTPDSSSVIPALTSICQQLAYNYTLPMDEMPDDLIPLMFYYKQLLLNASYDQPLIILLDSVDQLDGPMISLRLSWLTYELPDHVKIIVSCVSDGECEEYRFLKKALGKTDAIFLEVQTLDREMAQNVIKAMLQESSRTLSGVQWEIVNQTIDHCTLPIFLKLVYARVAAWKSYSLAAQLPWTVMESIMNLFDRVELQHGKTLVSFALSYITASKCGLSESELEDLISLDDIVLNDIFQYHLPPIRRIPPLLWTRIRSDLPNCISERDAAGVSVMNWYHRQFSEASKIRYLNDPEKNKYFHSMIADYFIGTWGGIEKPFKYTDVQKTRFHLDSDEGKADRKVPPQPNVYYAADMSVARFNVRKFGELPYHLTRSERFTDLFDMVLFSYEWIHSKLSSCPLQSVLNDFEDCRTKLKSMEKTDNAALREVQLLVDAIKLSAAILIQYPSMLSPQIIGRLLPLKDECPHISSLLKQCDQLGVNNCALTPISHCLHTPGGPLMYSLEGHSFAVFDFILTSDNRYILSVSNKFLMWDLSTGEVSREVDPKARGIMQVLVITGDDKLALTYSNYNDVWALDILTGEILTLKGEVLNLSSEILGIEVASDNKTAVVWCNQSWSSLRLRPTLQVIQRFDAKEELEENAVIITITYDSCNLFHVSYRIEDQFFLQTFVKGVKIPVVRFYCGIIITDDNKMYAANEKSVIEQWILKEPPWKKVRGLLPLKVQEEGNVLLSIIESHRKDFIVGANLRGFTAYATEALNKPKYFALPPGVRNISVQPLQVVSRILFTKWNQYAVAGIRRNLYIWSVSETSLMKIIDAHYGRIVEMLPLEVDDINAVATSSLDRTVKVWNMKNIFEQVHAIDRMELPIESITFGTEVAASVTRSTVGVWDLKTGKLINSLAYSPIGAIVTHAVISLDGYKLVSVESNHILVWDLRTSKVFHRNPCHGVRDLQIINKSDSFLVVCEEDDFQDDKFVSFKAIAFEVMLIQEEKFSIQFLGRKKESLKRPCVTVDGGFIVLAVVDAESDKDCIHVFSSSTGEFLHRIPLQCSSITRVMSCCFRGKESIAGVLTPGIGFIIDAASERVLSRISRWNENCSTDGRLGLFTSGSSLEVVELRYGSTVRVLLPKVSEGLVSFVTGFTANDEYVYYYHSTKRTIRLFRVSDGDMIANYRLSAEARVVKSTPDGSCLVVGSADGSVTMLLIADPKKHECQKLLSLLPSRCERIVNKSTTTPLSRWKAAVRLAKAISGSRASSRRASVVDSRVCSVS